MTMVTVLLILCVPGQPESVSSSIAAEAQIDQLVRQLDDANRAVRDDAEKALFQLGADVLDQLPPTDETDCHPRPSSV